MPKPYETLDDVSAIVADQIPEGVNLEYKGSDVLINRDSNKVCKTVSALANSAGGAFIIGIETKDLAPVRIDDGTPGPSRRDWIYRVINVGTFPAVETVEVSEFSTPTGTIYVIDVSPTLSSGFNIIRRIRQKICTNRCLPTYASASRSTSRSTLPRDEH